MTDRERQMIEYYIPHPRDPELEDGEYYYLQYTSSGERVIKVVPLDVLPYDDGTEYGIYQKRGTQYRRIDAGYDDPLRGVRMHDLYDNRQDCRDQTHMSWDHWEELRRLQKSQNN